MGDGISTSGYSICKTSSQLLFGSDMADVLKTFFPHVPRRASYDCNVESPSLDALINRKQAL